MKDLILEIIQRNYDKFTGTNKAELQSAEEIARLIELKPINESELNATLLVNFLRLPEDQMRHLAESMMAKRPEVFPDYWQQRCKLAEYCLEVSPCDQDITDEQIAAHKAYHNFIKDNPLRGDATGV